LASASPQPSVLYESTFTPLEMASGSPSGSVLQQGRYPFAAAVEREDALSGLTELMADDRTPGSSGNRQGQV
jgi:hypothetical protein